MKEIIEAFVGLFFFMLLTTTSLSVITTSIDAKNADEIKSGYVTEMENSNFSAPVIQKIFAEAESEGYVVDMKVYHNQVGTSNLVTEVNAQKWDVAANKYVYRSASELATLIGNTSDVYMVRIQVTFDYSFPLLDVVTPHTIIGYAR